MMTIQNKLVSGDPMQPSGSDVIVQIGVINVGEPLPDGWRPLTGNNNVSKIARVVLRYEIEMEGCQNAEG